MSLFTKKNYFIFVFVIILLFSTKAFGKDTKFKYSEEDVSNYFSGVISLNQNYDKSFDYLNKVKSLKNTHYNFNVQFIQLLVLLKKFDKAFVFSKNIWNQNELLFEADLLLGLRSFIEKDYVQAEKHFKRLNKVSNLNFIFDDFLGNILLTWVNASQKKQEESFNFLNKVPNHFNNLKKIQNSFLQCYFNTTETEIAFEQLINSKEYNFSRYNFFLANYFLHQNKKKSAEILIARSRNLYSSNILIKQTENFILNEKSEKIKKIFNCENPQDVLAEIFYVMANLYSSQKNYQLSNFYLRISLFLNKKFEPNKSLLAENFYYE